MFNIRIQLYVYNTSTLFVRVEAGLKIEAGVSAAIL